MKDAWSGYRLLGLRWAAMIAGGFLVRHFARVGSVGPGDTMSDLVQSDGDRILQAVALVLFVAVAVVWRERQTVPVLIAGFESVVLAVGLWPPFDSWLEFKLLHDMGQRPLDYRFLFAVALAGALIGLTASSRSARSSIRDPERVGEPRTL